MHNYLEKNMVAGMVGRNMESKTHPKKAENIFAHKKKSITSGKASEQAKSDMF